MSSHKPVLMKIGYIKEITECFKNDMEQLLLTFENQGKFGFLHFVKVWKDFNFSSVFVGLTHVHLIKECLDRMFYTVSKYICFPKSIYTQVGALYLLYGLYFKQPIKDFVKIRLTLEEYQIMENCVIEMKHYNELDPAVIFARLKSNDAFLYVAATHIYQLGEYRIKKHEPFFNNLFESSNSESSLPKIKALFNDDLVTKVKKIQTDYQKALEKFARKNPSVTSFSSNLIQEIDVAQQAFVNSEGPAVDDTETEQKKVKNKAFKRKDAVYRGSRKCITAVDINKN